MERSDFEVKTRLTQQIEKVERENAVLRKKVDGTDEQQRAFVNTLEVMSCVFNYTLKKII